MTTRHRYRAAAVLLLALAAGAACSDARPSTSPPAATRTPTPTPTSSSPTRDPEASAEAAVLAAYHAFWAAATEARAHPERRHPELAKYAIDKALAAQQATILLYRQQGIVEQGKPKLDPQVVALDIDAEPATAVIRDCVDVTNVRAIYRRTGKSALAPSKTFRHVSTSKATVFYGRWVIREVTTNRGQQC